MTSTELELTGRALTSWGSPGTRKGRKRSNCDPELRQVRGEYLTGWKGDADKNDEQHYYRTWMAKRIIRVGKHFTALEMKIGKDHLTKKKRQICGMVGKKISERNN